jgi:hypothetical protein
VAALADDPQSKTFYDPERDGTKCISLGIHEYWNNSADKKYSRNLGKKQGIELYTGPILLGTHVLPHEPFRPVISTKLLGPVRRITPAVTLCRLPLPSCRLPPQSFQAVA